MKTYKSLTVGAGTRLQSGIPKRPMVGMGDASGMVLRGVVTATYVVDDPQHPFADDDNREPVAVYCDVLTYPKYLFIPRALVSQDRGGMHSGRIWKPRAATIDQSGNPINLNQGTNPANLDGDHVLLQFINGNTNQPVIMRSVPHPSADVGNGQKDAGHRLKLKVADGDPDFWKHHGTFYGVSTDGDFVIDTTEAYAGESLENDASEPANPGDGTAGNYRVRLPAGAQVIFELDSGALITLEEKDGDAKLTLGDGAISAVLGEELQSWWDTVLKPKFDALDTHVHTAHNYVLPLIPAPGGPVPVVGTPSDATPKAAVPVYDTSTLSTKVKIPNG